MKLFSKLFHSLDTASGTNERIRLIREYFEKADADDAIWTCWFLNGNRIKGGIKINDLRQLCAEESGLPLWLVEDSHERVGDLAETIGLLLPKLGTDPTPMRLHKVVEEFILPLPKQDDIGKQDLILRAWQCLRPEDLLPFHKLLTGAFRMGVSNGILCKALGECAGVSPAVISQRLMGNWHPETKSIQQILHPTSNDEDIHSPLPFCLASPLEEDVVTLGKTEDWQVEWKWDGVRAQLIKSESSALLWSRTGESMNESFPDILEAAKLLPAGTCLDGEILAWNRKGHMSFSDLQRRLGRKSPGSQIQAAVPVKFQAYDLLRIHNQDIRESPMQERRKELEALIQTLPAQYPISISPTLQKETWKDYEDLRSQSLENQVEGLMLKRKDSAYTSGRHKGNWYKWKVAPMEADMVLVGAQMGHGKRANLFSDYSLAVWDQEELVVIAKAYSGLTDEEIKEVDQFIRKNITGRFGPIRSVEPQLVFQVAFEGIQHSNRRKVGLALRFPRIHRWRKDKPIEEAAKLDELLSLAGFSMEDSIDSSLVQTELKFE